MRLAEPNEPHGTDQRPTLTALDRLNLIYIAVIIAVIVVCHRRIPSWPVCLASYVGLAVVLAAFLKIARQNFHPVIVFIRDWYTPFLFLFHYEFTLPLNQSFAPLYAPLISRLAPGIPLVAEQFGHRVYFDHLLVPIERWFCGGFLPSYCFAQVFNARWFGEIMNLAYFSYFGYVPLVCGIFWFRPRREPFDDTMFRATMTLWVCFLFFVIFPTGGPRQFFGPEGMNLNVGYLFAWIMKFLFKYGEIPNGAFPSSHVAAALTVLFSAYRYQKRLFACLIIPFVLLCTSTVYVAEHYAIDVPVGFAAGWILYWLSGRAYGLLRPRFAEPPPAGEPTQDT